MKHGKIGRCRVRNAVLEKACVVKECKWHTSHWSGLYENGCYMLKDNSGCISGKNSGFTPISYELMEKGK